MYRVRFFLFVFLLIFFFPIENLHAQAINNLEIAKSRVLSKYGITDTIPARTFLVSNLPDLYSSKPVIDTLGCTVYPIYIPGEGIGFDELELELFLKNENEPSDYLAFLIDHDVTHSLHRLFLSEDEAILKIQKLDTELNADFARVLSTSYYRNKRLILMFDDFCYIAKGRIIYYIFDWSPDNKQLLKITKTAE